MRGKRPTRKQKEIIASKNLNVQNWLVVKNLLHEGKLHIIHKHSGKLRVIRTA